MARFGLFVFGVFGVLGAMLRAVVGSASGAMAGSGSPMGFMELFGAVGAFEFLAFAGKEQATRDSKRH